MDRKEFFKICAGGCLGLIGLQTTMSGCATQKQVNALINGDNLEVPIASFEKLKKGETIFVDSVVVRNPMLQYPIAVFRFSKEKYHALLMKCTHQGTVLKLYGDTLQCTAHGSEFSNSGAVMTGPATKKLRDLPVVVDNQILKISLK